MTEVVLRPIPEISDENRQFWEGTARGQLRLQRCGSCGHVRYPISHVCPRCLSDSLEWQAMRGKGEIFSYVVFHQVYSAAFASLVPYNVALIQLEEGPRMFSNIVGAERTPKVGDRVSIVFNELRDGIFLPQFELFA